MHDLLVEEYKVEWHVIEQLKQQNLMEWVRKMNVIENIVDEVIKKEIIYVFLTIFLYLLKCPQSLIL